jgi:hypothetical protein
LSQALKIPGTLNLLVIQWKCLKALKTHWI